MLTSIASEDKSGARPGLNNELISTNQNLNELTIHTALWHVIFFLGNNMWTGVAEEFNHAQSSIEDNTTYYLKINEKYYNLTH